MRVVMSLACCAILVVGCSSSLFDNDIRAAVRKRLTDPDSAQWGEFHTAGPLACVEVNSKTRSGGYAGFTTAFVWQNDGKWEVDTMDWEHECTKDKIRELSREYSRLVPLRPKN